MKIKNIYLMITFTALLCWALWNYETSLGLINKVYNILLPFLIGGGIAFIVNILLVRLEALWQAVLKRPWLQRLRRPVCLLLSLLIIGGLLTFVVLTVVPELQASIKTLLGLLPSALAKLNVYVQEKAAQLNLDAEAAAMVQQQANEIYHTLLNYLQNNKGLLFTRTVNATASLLDVVTNMAIGLVASVYLLLDKERLLRGSKRVLYACCRRERADCWAEAAAVANKIFTGFVAGQLTEAFLLGCMYFAGMLLFGFPYALIISLLAAVLGLIPILGTFISAVIGCFLILVAAPEKIWLFLLFFVVLQRIEGDFLYPRIVGKAVGLSELWVLAAVTVGGSVGGILGMLLSVPLCSVIYTLASRQVQQRLEQKNLHNL